MKRLLLLWIAFSSILANAHADLYIKEISKSKSYFLGIPSKTEILNVTEIWIGDSVVVRSDSKRIFILDKRSNSFSVLNRKHRTYVEVTLPLNMYTILPRNLVGKFEERELVGFVQEVGDSVGMMNKSCASYLFTCWNSQAIVPKRTKVHVWATEDVPQDLSLYHELLDNIRIFHNRGKKTRDELMEIRGIQLLNEMESGGFIQKKVYLDVVEQLTDKDPPEGIYDIPVGFERRDKFHLRDFK